MGVERDQRVLIFAPIGRDAPASAELLRSSRLETTICADVEELVREMDAGAGVVFLAEEGLFSKDTSPLTRWVDRQRAWSDLPFIVLTSHQEQRPVVAWRRNLVSALRNVSLLERPIQPITLTSTVQSALRARRRQYEIRALIRAREQAAQQLERLVVERTRALEEANHHLRREIAERARVEETLRQAQKIEAIGRLTGGVAHDFNNLLMVISGGLDMLDRQTDPARRRRLMEGMIQAAQRGASLTRQLLAFSRRQELKPESVDIARQIGGMRELLDRSLRGDVHVKFDFPDTLWPIEVDPGELELVILNLAVNARDAMPSGGVLAIDIRNRPGQGDGARDMVRLSIRDTGVGMAPDVAARVFEPFFTTKGVGQGTGLGLSQVYGFARSSGGVVEVDSEVGVGTEVSICIPRSAKALPIAQVPEAPAAPSPSASRARVLLVEDDEQVANLVGAMLNELGYDCDRAATAAAALDRLAAADPPHDLVFSDMVMPGEMGGLDLARLVAARRPGVPVVLTTGYSAAAAAAAADGIRLLVKPYRIEALAAELRAALADDPPRAR